MPSTLVPLLLAVLAEAGASNNPKVEHRHFSYSCGEVSTVALSYLEKHGVETGRRLLVNGFAITGRSTEGQRPWIDSAGSKINDLKVYWMYANRKSDEKLPVGVWHLRLDHYKPAGDFELIDDKDGGCNVSFRLVFRTGGANVVVLLVLDSAWGNNSNGRMEREYLEGISEEFGKSKPSH